MPTSCHNVPSSTSDDWNCSYSIRWQWPKSDQFSIKYIGCRQSKKFCKFPITYQDICRHKRYIKYRPLQHDNWVHVIIMITLHTCWCPGSSNLRYRQFFIHILESVYPCRVVWLLWNHLKRENLLFYFKIMQHVEVLNFLWLYPDHSSKILAIHINQIHALWMTVFIIVFKSR